MKKTIINILIISLVTLPVLAQNKQKETIPKREVTLYNPYKPSLADVVKKSYLPDMTDTAKVKSDFKYDLQPKPFMPSYTIGQIRPASLLPDPLSKLYKSFIIFGFGNHISPLAEVSITNERSKKGAIGIVARHFSTNGKIKLQNGNKAFAGYMDNDVSLFGKKFFYNSILNGSVDLNQKTRYAYGCDPFFYDYDPTKKEVRLNYYNAGATIGLASTKLDSTDLSYNFNLGYNYFHNTSTLYQHSVGLTGIMAKLYKGFYVGSGIEFDHYSFSDSAYAKPRYIAALSPFIKKSSKEWSAKLGFQALLDRGVTESAKLHIYPDIYFSFNIVPSYISFFADLSGKLVKNEPLNVIGQNPFLFPDSLFKIPNTDYALILEAGLTGSTGIEGVYQLSASYSVVNDMLLFTNNIILNGIIPSMRGRGNYFNPLSDDAEILNVHGEISGKIAGFLSFNAEANYYRYTLSEDFAWNKPDWDASVGLKYNLKNKIIAGIDVNTQGKRKLLVTTNYNGFPGFTYGTRIIDMPAHLNINLSAEYRYTKILSFWLKLNNISFNRYYEWAFYPSLRFMGMVGFTYSL